MMTSRRHFSKMTLLSVCFGLFMIQLDLTVVNVALKSIQDNLHADVAALQWVVDAYAILFSSLMLTTGDLGDIFGRRRIYTSGIVLFVLGSIACASAPSYVFLIVARSLQGIGAAAVLPNSLAILRNAFPDARLRARAIGWWAGVSGFAVVAGPTLGGWLVGTLGWRSVFWINVPVGVLGLWLTLGFVSESSHPMLDFQFFRQPIFTAANAVGFQRFHYHVGEACHSRDQWPVATGREDAGRRARPDQEADPLASLGNDLPQAGHILVWIVDTDGHRALPFWCSLWRFLPLNFNCYILRSTCLLEGDELAAEYRWCYI
ncbi:MFS transporter [Acidithiobacillus sulfurivorans]|uniref:MFS transporter n=1 Tax=Acidithiobacillus sulfurivorans TaxID=1958756 RepID=A0ABS6A2T0_9PROT|nr:MFS transporter [Acidithiobacillus sulfurivorans]MBU2761813.1 MFS transporter [Acidithiobacillus sulfurivorans]